jgi:DNA damage-binding protein 1
VLSARSYNSYVRGEFEREQWEFENYPEGEVAEMVDLFEKRGMAREDAEVAIGRMARHKEFFVNLMMTEELSLPVSARALAQPRAESAGRAPPVAPAGRTHTRIWQVPDADDDLNSLKDGAAMFAAFASFGVLPVAAIAVAPLVAPQLSVRVGLFPLSCVVTAVALAALGGYKVRASSAAPHIVASRRAGSGR